MEKRPGFSKLQPVPPASLPDFCRAQQENLAPEESLAFPETGHCTANLCLTERKSAVDALSVEELAELAAFIRELLAGRAKTKRLAR